jgi:hypothetical protein
MMILDADPTYTIALSPTMSTLAHQTLVEHQILAHIKDALRLTLETRVATISVGRKLSSVRFMAASFERHLQRLLDLEEDGGYMTLVQERKPDLLDQVLALRGEHAEFRQELRQIVGALENLAPEGEEERFHGLCHKLHALVDRLDAHDAQEIHLLEQVLVGETGHVS